MSIRILLVDDDLQALRVVAEALEWKGYSIATASSGEAAVETLDNEEFDLVITDLNMYETDGFSVLNKAKERNPETVVMLLSGDVHVFSLLHALSPAFDDSLLKPCPLDELFEHVASCLEKLAAKRRDACVGRIRRVTPRRAVRLSAS